MKDGLKASVLHLAETYANTVPRVERKELYLEIEKYLSHLAAANGIVSDGETEFINECLDLGLKNRDLANFITSYNTYGKRFGSVLPKIFEEHLDDLQASAEYAAVMLDIGKEMIIADNCADENEAEAMLSYVKMLTAALSKRHPEVEDILQKSTELTPAAEKADEEKSLDELLEEMDELIGLQTVKQNVYSLVHLQDIQKERERRGMKKIPISNHLVFLGNPGTGKTTIARLIARIYYKLGVIKTNSFVEVDRSGLVAGYVGQTAIEVKSVMDEAKNGVLFIDEAYALSSGPRGDYGHEAIQTILKRMEDERDSMVVIVAGYPRLMEHFLESNPGLESRFSKKIYFPDYTPDELIDILKYMARKNGITVSEEGLDYAYDLLKKQYDSRDENFANAREVRNMFETAIVRQADRLYGDGELTDDELQTLRPEDFVLRELSFD